MPDADHEFIIRTLHVGPMAACCYLAGRDGGDAAVIDPGDDADRIIESVGVKQMSVRQIILTHGHADHIGALEAVRDAFPEAQVLVHEADAPMLERPSLNLSLFLGKGLKCRPADKLLHDGDVLEIGGRRAEILHVPGHTPGGICIHLPEEKVAFTGDVLFAGGIGRSDFPGGDGALLIDGIRERLLTLPPETLVYPGHGPSSTIEREKTTNPFL